MAKDNGVSVSPDTLREKANEINEIDEWLESVSGGTSAGKTAIRNALIKDEANSKVIDQMVNSIVEFLTKSNAGDPQQAAIYFGVTKALDAKFGKQADEFITAEAEKNKSTGEQVSATDDEIAARRAVRKQKVTEFQALKGILEMFGKQAEIADIPDPKVLRGAIPGQKRKPRAMNLMNFSIDGVPVPAEQNSLSGVASILGTKVKPLREAIKAAGVDTKKPENFSVEFNGKTVSAEKSEQAESENGETAADVQASEESVAV